MTEKIRRHNVCGTTNLYIEPKLLTNKNLVNYCVKRKPSWAIQDGLPAGASPPGGDDGNRTRVRKPIRTTFYERSLSLTFPHPAGDKHPARFSSLQYTFGTQALPKCVHRWSTPRPKPRYSSEGRAAIKQLLIQNYCCRLILKRRRLKRWRKPLLAYYVSRSPSKPLHPH